MRNGCHDASFYDWIVSQQIKDCRIEAVSDESVSLKTESATAAVNFYSFEDMPDIVELVVNENGCEDPAFFLHFEVEDLDRAKELFGEMRDVLVETGKSSTRRVLLCCTVGMTTSMFAAKLAEVTKTLSLDYAFEAKALEDAKREGGSYDAVMLAPQVGFRRREVAAAFPRCGCL